MRQQKQVAKTTNTKHTDTNKEPLGARIFLLKGKEGTGCNEPTSTPPPRPLRYPLPTATHSPATQCPLGQNG